MASERAGAIAEDWDDERPDVSALLSHGRYQIRLGWTILRLARISRMVLLAETGCASFYGQL